MRLAYTTTSPFARKALILLHELDLLDQIEIFDPGAVTPVSTNFDISNVNPLGMIPVLTLNENEGIYDSPVICEYLNHIASGHFYPLTPEARFRSLQLQALADGIMDISVAMRYETALRPEALRWADWISEQSVRVDKALAAMDQQVAQFDPAFTIGEVAVVAALGYRDFRYSDRDWRTPHPALADWFNAISQRESVRKTIPA